MYENDLISLQNACMYFGGVKAIDDLSFNVKRGSIMGIIGPNGAGKTTIFNVITGVYTPTSGNIRFLDRSLNKALPHEITGDGISRTFQNIRLFESETVLNNLKIASFAHTNYGLFATFLRTPRFRKEEARIDRECREILALLNLSDYAESIAGSLAYGVQRRIEIARALCCKPQVILLDEPAAGMNPAEIDDLNQLILRIREALNLTIIVIEHQMRLVMGICDEILVVNFGKKLAQGKPEEVKSNEQVLEAYLGKAKG